MATYQGTCTCQNCGKPAEVWTDKNSLAYYKCGPCGFFPRHTSMKSSQGFLATIKRHTDPEQAPAPEAVPVPKNKPPKAGFFDGVLA